MVDSTGHIFRAEDFFQKEKELALDGIAYAPNVGFASVRNVVNHTKYPYDPFYGGISPRVGTVTSQILPTGKFLNLRFSSHESWP